MTFIIYSIVFISFSITIGNLKRRGGSTRSNEIKCAVFFPECISFLGKFQYVEKQIFIKLIILIIQLSNYFEPH